MPKSSKSHATSSRHLNRLALGEAAVLPLPQVVALIPMADHLVRRWLRNHDLVHDLDGRKVVIWADVLSAIRGRPTKPPVSRSMSLVRANLSSKE